MASCMSIPSAGVTSCFMLDPHCLAPHVPQACHPPPSVHLLNPPFHPSPPPRPNLLLSSGEHDKLQSCFVTCVWHCTMHVACRGCGIPLCVRGVAVMVTPAGVVQLCTAKVVRCTWRASWSGGLCLGRAYGSMGVGSVRRAAPCICTR